MSGRQSYLSSPRYGYDFVVATTQASINAGLLEYLQNVGQPTTSVCFLVDEKGNPTQQISLDDLKKLTGGIDPFSIPDGTDYADPRITTMTKNKFVAGIKLTLGLPPGVPPDTLPPIVSLGSSANNVVFNMLCSDLVIVQNSPPNGFGSGGSWNVWSQPAGAPWYFRTLVDLTFEDLDPSLDTPYFKNHQAQQAAIRQRLGNLGSGAFSLQQLLFDLDNAALQSVPSIQGLDPGSDAGLVLTKYFVNLYAASAKTVGAPVLSVVAVANAPDASSLHLTAMEREIGQFVDHNGVVVPNPTTDQQQVVTLDYLCAANADPLPAAAPFNWNWVEPADVGNMSGVVSINRNTFANYLKNLLLPSIMKSCIAVAASAEATALGAGSKYGGTFTQGQTPGFTIPQTGSQILNMSFSGHADAHDKTGLTYCETELWSDFQCSVAVQGNKITLVQHLTLTAEVTFDYTSVKTRFFDKSITDVYTLTVDQDGSIVLSPPESSSQDNSESPDRSWLVNLFTGVNDIINAFKSQLANFLDSSITDIPAASLQSFVFPGARVFTYTNVQFSDNQDLTADITYLTPSAQAFLESFVRGS